MIEFKIMEYIVESGAKFFVDGKDRDTFIALFSNSPETLRDFANFVREKYRDLRGIDLAISSQKLTGDEEGDEEVPYSYYELKKDGTAHLYVIDDVSRSTKRRDLAEIARGKITRKEFIRFINYLSENISGGEA
ncbi:hypothetical protein HY450_01735 [Candidatus Pacearchaeota archaeon]|nr:hypothetical protein [Candidatus Pacearchaeota archaeon]